MITKLCLFAALCTACTINGKSYGPTTSGGGTVDSSNEGADTASPPYPNAPQDPWIAVKGDQPTRRSNDKWIPSSTKGDCTGAHDHCFEPDVWLLVWKENIGNPFARLAVFGPSGPIAGEGSGDYTVYRTVPATHANMVPGTLVFGLPRPLAVPDSLAEAVYTRWVFGVVTSVEADVGVYRIEGYQDSFLLSAARVAVLQWKPGGKVEIIGNKRRDQLAVRASDVFLPDK